ncbi:MAG TPA: hypothetical protein VFO52_08285 [Longimicrobiales bacterium]|nr:hypothetical protein [Longimicrobiales bacterium]
MFSLWALLQAAVPAQTEPTFGQRVMEFLDTPAPYSPLSEYLVVLFLLWLLARRQRPKDFGAQAQDVLEEKFRNGELDQKTYERYRQELSMRLRKE